MVRGGGIGLGQDYLRIVLWSWSTSTFGFQDKPGTGSHRSLDFEMTFAIPFLISIDLDILYIFLNQTTSHRHQRCTPR